MGGRKLRPYRPGTVGGDMSEIRYICFSDLHFGADNSLLTHLDPISAEADPTEPSEVLVSLVTCLKELLRGTAGQVRPTLVLNGDVLELAISQDNMAVMAFERFLELLFPPDEEPLVANQLLLIPGNHDHHLWETAREAQYVRFLQRHPPGQRLEAPWHTTKMFERDFVGVSLLNGVIHRYPHMKQRGVRVDTAYPNYALLSADLTKCIIFTHGHFIEPIYMLMTTVANQIFNDREIPKTIWQIEAENFAWIDFFWSALGRSGEAGKEVERIYSMLLVPEVRRKLAGRLSEVLGASLISCWPELGEDLGRLLQPLVSSLLTRVSGLEKMHTGAPLSPEAVKGLKAHVEGPLLDQLRRERSAAAEARITFVFGHTHKPFVRTMAFQGVSQPASVYNTGGWVVDTADPEPVHGGAIVLVDEHLNVVSLRMYNETSNGQAYAVSVEATETTPSQNPLYPTVSAIVQSFPEPWSSFAETASQNLATYHRNFQSALNQAAVP